MAVFGTNGNEIEVAGETVTVDGDVSADDIKTAAEERGIKRFTPHDADTGHELDRDDFPYDGDVEVREYNENA